MQTEETKKADWNGPMGIVYSVSLSSVFGWIYLLALTSVVTDIPYLLDTGNDVGGYAIAQALYATFHRRYGTGAGGIACLVIIAVAVFLCGTACVTSNSRMGYAFSRDGAMPFSHVLYATSTSSGSPCPWRSSWPSRCACALISQLLKYVSAMHVTV